MKAALVNKMSRDEVIREFRRLDLLAPDPLGAIDLPQPLWFALRRYFGSIEKARHAAGVRAPDLERRWSKSNVITEIRRLHQKGTRITDLALKEEHAGLLSAMREYFGSIVTARRAARVPEPAPLKPKKRQRWDEERVIAEIEELHRSGESIAASKVPNALLKAGKRYYDTWQNAVEAAGFSYDEVRLVREPYSKAELVDILRDLAKKQPRMTLAELDRQSFYPALVHLFGSVDAALKRARLQEWPVRERLPAMSREEAIKALRQRERVGKGTNWGAVQAEDHLLWHSGVLHFGEWERFTEAAGVDTESHQRRWTSEALLDALRDRDRKGLSMKPEDVKRDEPRLFWSVVGHFKSYIKAVRRVAYAPWALTYWTPEMVIERLRSIAGKRKRLTGRQAGGALVNQCQKHFGSYSAACRAAGLDAVVGNSRR
jgi:hypothetical protein